MLTYAQFVNRISEKFGAGASSLINEVFSDPEFASALHLVGVPGARPNLGATPQAEPATIPVDQLDPSDVHTALAVIRTFPQAGLRLGSRLAPSMMTVMRTFQKPLQMKAVLVDSDATRRPPEDGLLEMLESACVGFGRYGKELPQVDWDNNRAMNLHSTIGTLRELIQVQSRFVKFAVRSLAILEHEAYTSAKRPYDLVRPYVQAHPDLATLFEGVEEYFYGSAQAGVKTRRENDRMRETITKSAEQKAMAAAYKHARKGVVGELSALFAEITRANPDVGVPASTPQAPDVDPRHTSR